MIAVQNRLVIIAGGIRNAFCTAPCAEQIWYTFVQEFGARFGGIVVLNCALYCFKTSYNSFHNLFGNFLRDIGFTPSRADQDLWLIKSGEYHGYNYIATHVEDIIIA